MYRARNSHPGNACCMYSERVVCSGEGCRRLNCNEIFLKSLFMTAVIFGHVLGDSLTRPHFGSLGLVDIFVRDEREESSYVDD